MRKSDLDEKGASRSMGDLGGNDTSLERVNRGWFLLFIRGQVVLLAPAGQ